MTYSRLNFERRLVAGTATEAHVIQQLREAGITVEVPEMPEGSKTSDYTKNQIDAIANGKILEIKGRNLVFTCVDDYPYPTLFVEGVSGFDAKVRTPDYYVNVSNKTGAIICLDVAATRHTWTVENVTDRFRNFPYDMYISQTSDWINWDDFLGRIT
jgi:hypothetical protein